MNALPLTASVTVFLILVSLLRGTGEKMDRKRARLGQVREAREREAAPERKAVPLRRLWTGLKEKQETKLRGQQLKKGKPAGKLKVLEEELQLAGIPLTPVQFWLIRIASGVLLALLGRFLGSRFPLPERIALLLPVMCLAVGLLLPHKLLESAVQKRKAVFRDALPDVMDLLIVSVEAGLGFDAALLRLYKKNKSPLMQELMRAIQDVQHGMTKKEAYTNMAARCQVKEITSFLNALLQAEQLGISVKSVLKSQADSLREDRRQRAEEKALKAPVKMLVPLVIFIFPVIFIILLGPAVMNVIEYF